MTEPFRQSPIEPEEMKAPLANRKPQLSRFDRLIEDLQQQNRHLKQRIARLKKTAKRGSRAQEQAKQLRDRNAVLKQQISELKTIQKQQSRYEKVQQLRIQEEMTQLQQRNDWLHYQLSRLTGQPLPPPRVPGRRRDRTAAKHTKSRPGLLARLFGQSKAKPPARFPNGRPRSVPPAPTGKRDAARPVSHVPPPSQQPRLRSPNPFHRHPRKPSRLDRVLPLTIVILVGLGLSWALGRRAFQSPSPPSPPNTQAILPTGSSETQLPQVYQPQTPPDLESSEALEDLVQELVDLAAARGLPKKSLSITLINVNDRTYAGHNAEELRYPASVVKLFWMVALYHRWHAGTLPEDSVFVEDLKLMVRDSSNDAASRILDRLTETESGPALEPETFADWQQRRQQLNEFFQQAGYRDLSISQKTFPIDSLGMARPEGRDAQLRGDEERPNRNQISTDQAARLMYEIVTGQAIDKEASREMARWLHRDLESGEWQTQAADSGRFNPVRAFFGESLPSNVQIFSKAGWTSRSRQEVAFISTRDLKTASYVLAVFGEDPAYAKDREIFPLMSRRVLDYMLNRKARNSPDKKD